jgi:Flp pilus assembly protein TadG
MSTRLRIFGRRPDQPGQAMVEFALAVPVVFLILLGLFDVGRLVFINNEIAEAAREGARWGAVQGRAASQAAGSDTAVTDEVASRIAITPSPTITLSCTDLGGAGGACGSGDLLTIDVSAAVRPLTPLIGDIVGPFALASQAQMTIH